MYFIIFFFKATHDSGSSSFFLNKKGSFKKKCIICDEKHGEHFHNYEFATENREGEEINDFKESMTKEVKLVNFTDLSNNGLTLKKDSTGKTFIQSESSDTICCSYRFTKYNK